MMGHAVLSPSAAGRWLACTPSARLEERFPDNAGDYAKEGTLAHSFGETFLLGLILGENVSGRLEALREDEFYSIELEDYADGYAAFVWEEFCRIRKETPDAILRIEEKIDLTAYVPEGFGTGDAVIIADGTLTVIDLKYGKGVKVSAVKNKQMMLYALGTMNRYELLYGVDKVRMIIYQPRLGNVSQWEADALQLKEWAESYLVPRASMAFRGEGDFVPGEHCRFCRAKAQCKALAEKNIEAARHEFDEVGLMTDEEVAQAISVIFFFNVLAAIIFPALGVADARSARLGDHHLFGVVVVRAILFCDGYYFLGIHTFTRSRRAPYRRQTAPVCPCRVIRHMFAYMINQFPRAVNQVCEKAHFQGCSHGKDGGSGVLFA